MRPFKLRPFNILNARHIIDKVSELLFVGGCGFNDPTGNYSSIIETAYSNELKKHVIVHSTFRFGGAFAYEAVFYDMDNGILRELDTMSYFTGDVLLIDGIHVTSETFTLNGTEVDRVTLECAAEIYTEPIDEYYSVSDSMAWKTIHNLYPN